MNYKSSETSLRMVAPGAGFWGGTLYRPQSRWRPKKKKGLRCKTSWFSVQKYVMTKNKVFAYQSVSFRSQKKTTTKNKWCHPKMVTPGAGRPPPPPQQRHCKSYVFWLLTKKQNRNSFIIKANCLVANKYNIRQHVTAIPAKTLALLVFISQGANCEVLDAWLIFFSFSTGPYQNRTRKCFQSNLHVMQLFRSVVSVQLVIAKRLLATLIVMIT